MFSVVGSSSATLKSRCDSFAKDDRTNCFLVVKRIPGTFSKSIRHSVKTFAWSHLLVKSSSYRSIAASPFLGEPVLKSQSTINPLQSSPIPIARARSLQSAPGPHPSTSSPPQRPKQLRSKFSPEFLYPRGCPPWKISELNDLNISKWRLLAGNGRIY